MKIVSEVYSELGKAFINLGQAVIIAAFVARFFTQQPVGGIIAFAGIIMGVLFIVVGLVLIQKAHYQEKLEEQNNGSYT